MKTWWERNAVRERERDEVIERERLVAVRPRGGLAFTKPFFLDLFIQMKGQRERERERVNGASRGLCRTITLSTPNLLNRAAFRRALITSN